METTRWVVGAVVVLLSLPGKSLAADPSYAKDIKPILANYCTECHSANSAKAGIKLDAVADMLKAGKKGAAVVAGKPDDSLLVKTINGMGKQMPPKKSKKKVAADELAKIKAWIKAGAKDDSGAKTSVDVERPQSFAALLNRVLGTRRDEIACDFE